MSYKKLSEGTWAEIKVKHCSGVSAKELGEMFNVSHRTIQDKCRTECWPTPNNLRKDAERKLELADTIDNENTKDLILKKWQKRKEQHRENMFLQLAEKLEDPEMWENLKIKSAHDLEKVDTVMRRTVGLEENITKEEKSPVSMNLFQQITVATPEQIADSIDV